MFSLWAFLILLSFIGFIGYSVYDSYGDDIEHSKYHPIFLDDWYDDDDDDYEPEPFDLR